MQEVAMNYADWNTQTQIDSTAFKTHKRMRLV